MSFYMITEGTSQISHVYIGKTEEEVVAAARELINQWHEYALLSDEEIIELTKSESMEFDLVEIHAPWPGNNCSNEKLIALYQQQQT